MRVSLLIYGSLDTISGGYLYDRKLVEYLQRQGDLVEVISLPWRNYTRHLADNLSTTLFRRLKQLGTDVLLQDELNHPSLFWLNSRLRESIQYPRISIVHHLRCREVRPVWQNHFYAWIERRYLSSVDGFIFNSQTTHQAVAMNLRLYPKADAHPYVVAYPAGDRLQPQIEEAEITQRTHQHGPLRLFFLGNLISRKGLHILLTALGNLPRGVCTLTVVGSSDADNTYTRSIHRQVATSQLTDRVRFCGPLEEDKLIPEMRSSHLLVVPSTYEGFGIVYLEGMGFGLPAIGTTGGAAREIITDGKDGYLIPPGDAATLSSRLIELAHDRERLLQMSLTARRRFLAHPTWDQTGERIRRFLSKLIK